MKEKDIEKKKLQGTTRAMREEIDSLKR